MNALLLVAALHASPADSVLCPAYPGDPPWRPITCWLLTRLGVPRDRPPFKDESGQPVEVRWE